MKEFVSPIGWSLVLMDLQIGMEEVTFAGLLRPFSVQ